MRIPKSFNLFGHTITVECDDLKMDEMAADGIYSNKVKQITLHSSISKTKRETVFLHEVVHAILKHLGEEELNENEKFVDLMAQMLHQFLTTQKF